MPIPTTDNTAVRVAERLRQLARAVRLDCVKYIAQCDTTPPTLNAHSVINSFTISLLVPVATEWAQLKDVAGVPAALMQMFPGTWADEAAVTADLNAAATQIETCRAYIVSTTPVNATTGYTETQKINAGGTGYDDRVIAAATPVANLRTRLVALRDAFTA